MSWKKCPKCDLNYIKDDQELCDVCAANTESIGCSFEKLIIRHRGRNIFMVFQGKEYLKELKKGYISAPYKDVGGNSPSHWTMLENVKPGDIIFHGLAQCISAISVATSTCFTSKIQDGITEVRQVNCLPIIINKTIATSEFLEEIIKSCSRYKYQPFDKNGNGRQGYLFDLNDELAGVFSRALIERNPDLLTKIPELKEFILY